MENVEKELSIRLRFDFYRSVVTFGLASLGGEITLLHTLFTDAPNQSLAYLSIGLLIFACVFVLGAKEALVRRISPIPDFRNRLMRGMTAVAVTSLKGEWIMSFLAGIAFGLGLVLFGIFIVLA
jgi:Na+-transporting NADH:ubiquinone oxidoreductase subunit NqrD